MAELTTAVPVAIAGPRPTRRLLRRAFRSANITIGAGILFVLVILTTFASVITHYDPVEMVPGDRLLQPGAIHPFGTDKFGRDVLTRVLYGGAASRQVWV